MEKLITTSFLTILLAACQQNNEPQPQPENAKPPIPISGTPVTPVAPEANAQPSASVIAFIEANYGDQELPSGDYVQGSTHHAICAYRQALASKNYHYLALCSTDDLNPEKNIDLYVLTSDASDVIASNTGIPTQAADVSILSLGGGEFGFVISQREINQSLITGTTTLYALQENELPEAMQFVNQLDNTHDENCKNSEYGCEEISRTLLDVPSPEPNSDLTIIERNKSNGISEENRCTLKFNPVTKTYLAPEELQRSY